MTDDMKAWLRERPEVIKQANAFGTQMGLCTATALAVIVDETTPWGRACLLEALREAWADPRVCTCYTAPEDDGMDWSCIWMEYDGETGDLNTVEHIGIGRTEGEAILAAWAAVREGAT